MRKPRYLDTIENVFRALWKSKDFSLLKKENFFLSSSYSCSICYIFIVEFNTSSSKIDQCPLHRIFFVIIDKCEWPSDDLWSIKTKVHLMKRQMCKRTTNFFTQPMPFSSKKFKYPRRDTTGDMRTSSIDVIYFNAMPDVFIRLSIERDFGILGDIEPVMLLIWCKLDIE